MTQTNDSELEGLKKDLIESIDMRSQSTPPITFIYHTALSREDIGNYVERIYSLGIQNGIAKAEKVTRFEVIDHKTTGQGRIVVERGVKVELSYQDDDRTLKVFLTDR